MTRTARTALAGVVALTAAIALTGCQSDPEGPTPSPTVTTATPTPSPTPSPTATEETPEGAAAVAAEEAVHAHYAMLDASLQNPETFNPDDLKQVAIGSALIDAQNRFNAIWGQQGLRQTGSTVLTEVALTSVDLAPSDNIPIVEFRVCWNTSGLDVVDADGNSAIPADHNPLGVERVGVANYEYPTGPWLVAFTEFKEGETC